MHQPADEPAGAHSSAGTRRPQPGLRRRLSRRHPRAPLLHGRRRRPGRRAPPGVVVCRRAIASTRARARHVVCWQSAAAGAGAGLCQQLATTTLRPPTHRSRNHWHRCHHAHAHCRSWPLRRKQHRGRASSAAAALYDCGRASGLCALGGVASAALSRVHLGSAIVLRVFAPTVCPPDPLRCAALYLTCVETRVIGQLSWVGVGFERCRPSQRSVPHGRHQRFARHLRRIEAKQLVRLGAERDSERERARRAVREQPAHRRGVQFANSPRTCADRSPLELSSAAGGPHTPTPTRTHTHTHTRAYRLALNARVWCVCAQSRTSHLYRLRALREEPAHTRGVQFANSL